MFEDSFLKSDKNTPRKALSFPGALIIHAFIIGAAYPRRLARDVLKLCPKSDIQPPSPPSPFPLLSDLA